jgi:RHS repeat-associated protein
MAQAIHGPRVRCPRPRLFIAPVLLVILSLWHSAAHAQTCPAPWSSASSVFGTFYIQGTGNAASAPYALSVNQVETMLAVMPAQLGACAWAAYPALGIGQIRDSVTLHDQFTEDLCTPDPPQKDNWDVSGSSAQPQLSMGISGPFNAYSFGAGGSGNGIFTANGCLAQTTQPLLITWGPLTGINPQNLPMPDTAELSGVSYFSDAPVDVGSTLQANWNMAWSFSPVADDSCEDCKRQLLGMSASDISVRSQSLGEDLPIAGTPFFLHYESSRAMGRAGVDVVAMNDAHALGGWTLSVHHVLEPLLQLYCAGGSCTPYAKVPKALFLGNGDERADDRVQAAYPLNGYLYVAAEDGSELYAFDTHGIHRQTVRALTGALRYTFAYDAFNRLASITDESNNVTTIQRDASGNPTAIVAPFGQTTTLLVDLHGYLSQVTDPAGHATLLTNSVSGLLTKLTDPKGKTYTFQYDTYGRLSQHADPAGGSISLARTENASGFTITETTALGRIDSYQVGFTSVVAQTGRQFTNTWQSGLQATESSVLAAGQVNESGALPDGTSYSLVKSPDPRWGIQVPIAASETESLGNLTMSIARSRTISLRNAANPFSLRSQTDTETINGRTYQSVYTATSRSFVDTSPIGRQVTRMFDAKERPISVEVAGLAATQITYNAHGQVASISQGTRSTSLGYDAQGRLHSITNPLGQKSTFAHDPDGHLTSAIFPDGRSIQLGYDLNGNLTSVTPPGRGAHKFSYSATNMTTGYTPPPVPGTGETKFTYNVDQDLTAITRPDGQKVTFAYDTAGRVKTLTSPSASIHYLYDTVTGNLSSATIPGGEKITYGYNGPLLTSWALSGAVKGSVGRTYDDNFEISSQTVNGANTVNFGYDADGLLLQSGTLQLAYSSTNALLTGSSLGLATDSRSYDSYGDLANYSASYGSTVLYSVAITRDAAARVTTVAENVSGSSNTWDYAYDLSGRLVTVTLNGATAASYTYDTNSNRSSVSTSQGTTSATYDAQDRLLSYGVLTYTYTTNGEVAGAAAGSQSTTYQYDALGYLIGATLPNGTVISYVLDSEHNRVGKSVNGVQRAGFLYDAGDVVAQLDGSNKLVAQFIYGVASNAPDYMIKAGVTYRIFSDPLGSPRLIVNTSNGQVVQRLDYDAFGNVTNDTNPGFQPFGFAGGLYDPDTGLLHLHARDYDPRTGRFISKDPILFAGSSANLYGYVLNDPVNLTDPSGLKPCARCKDKKPPQTKPPTPPPNGHAAANKVGEQVVKEVAGESARQVVKNADNIEGVPEKMPGADLPSSPKAIKETEKLQEHAQKQACESVAPTSNVIEDLWKKASDALSGNPQNTPKKDTTTLTPEQQSLQQQAQKGANDPAKNAY